MMFIKILLGATMFSGIAYAGLVFDINENIDGQKFSVEYQITTKSGAVITASKNYQCQKYNHTFKMESENKEFTTYLPNEKITKIPLENEEFALVTVPDACNMAAFNTIFSKYTCDLVDGIDCSGEFPIDHEFKTLTYWSENDQFNTLIAHYGKESYENPNAKFKDVNAKITYNKIIDETPTAENMNFKFDPFNILPIKLNETEEERYNINPQLNPYYAKYIAEDISCNLFLNNIGSGTDFINTKKFKPFENGTDLSIIKSNCIIPLNERNEKMEEMKGLLVYYKTPEENNILYGINQEHINNKNKNLKNSIYIKSIENKIQ